MDKATCIFAMVIVAVGLVVFNIGVRRGNYDESREISGYEYARLHTIVDLYSEVADAAGNDLKHDTVTIAEYNEIMHKAEVVKARKALQKIALQETSRTQPPSFSSH